MGLRIGAVCGVVGGAGFVLVGGLHGNLPGETEAALRYLAPRSDWTAVHLAAMVFAVLWIPAFMALAGTMRTALGQLVGRMALISLVVAVAVFIVDYSIDGYSMKFLADDWAAASAADRPAKVQVAAAVLGVVRGTVRSTLTWLFGVPFLLAGLAIATERSWQRWLGWIAVVTGGCTVLAGLAAFVRARAEDPLFLVGILFSFGSFMWLAIVAAMLWNRKVPG